MFYKVNILVFIDNRVGYEILKYLISQKSSNICGIVTHPNNTALYNNKIKQLVKANHIKIWPISRFRLLKPTTLKQLKIDYIVSAYFDYIIDSEVISYAKKLAINVHPGYLPYNKGFYYYIWALLDGTPAGVSIHCMNDQVDSGDIISQKIIQINLTDNAETIYKKHENEAINLFKLTWPNILNSNYQRYPQKHKGTMHTIKQTEALAHIDPNKSYRLIDLLNQLRITSDQNKCGCVVNYNNKSYVIHLQLQEIVENMPTKLIGKN